jgi:hypothetical protein
MLVLVGFDRDSGGRRGRVEELLAGARSATTSSALSHLLVHFRARIGELKRV